MGDLSAVVHFDNGSETGESGQRGEVDSDGLLP